MECSEGKLNGLDLFSGIGGIGLALEPWVRTVAYCEQDRYAQGVLLSRMQSGDIDRAPIFSDVRKLQGSHFETKGKPEIIFGGFPCQDISSAGRGEGLAGKRSGLFFEIVRLTKEIGPTFVFLENVPAIRTRGLREVIRAFTEIGYDCRWTCLSAESVGAPHKRERWFLLAHAYGAKLRNQQQWPETGWDVFQTERETKSRFNGEEESLAHSTGSGLPLGRRSEFTESKEEGGSGIQHESERCSEEMANSESVGGHEGRLIGRAETKFSLPDFGGQHFRGYSWWATEPNVGRVAHGISHRVDRIKCLGNSVVPKQVREAFLLLSGMTTWRDL